jgi:protein involved in polysaccharide export with SLBB domain
MKVSVLLKEVVGNLIFVDGEAPARVFTSRGPVTVQHAIALAGGTRETAEPRRSLSFEARRASLARTTDFSNDFPFRFLLKRNDLVYVPRSTIARADVWVTRTSKADVHRLVSGQARIWVAALSGKMPSLRRG